MIKFTKMQGCGNDYVYMDTFSGGLPDLPALSVRLSDRHFGVGGDGIIVLSPSDKADFRMDIYNADGSRAEMCGNGIRCAAKYAVDNGLADKTELTVDTLAGIKTVTLLEQTENSAVASVDMGVPLVAERPLTLTRCGVTVEALPVDMGNPHAVIFCGDPDRIPLETLGPALERDPAFPNRANIEFVAVGSGDTLKMRVWERGSGETLACGTGSCAAAAAAVSRGLVKNECSVILRGGTLKLRYDRPGGHIIMTGPATTVFKGTID